MSGSPIAGDAPELVDHPDVASAPANSPPPPPTAADQMALAVQSMAATQRLLAEQLINNNHPRGRADKIKIKGFNDQDAKSSLPHTFIRDCDMVFVTTTANGDTLTESQKVLFAVTNTEGRAHDWASTWFTQTPAATWTSFVTAFLSQFVAPDDELQARSKLRLLRPSKEFNSLTEAIRHYNATFDETALRLPNDSPDVLTMLYKGGLYFPLQREVDIREKAWAQLQPADALKQPSLMLLKEWAHELCQRVQSNWKNERVVSNSGDGQRGQRYTHKRQHPQVASTTTTNDDPLPVNANHTHYRQQGALPPASRPPLLSPPDRDFCFRNNLCFRCKQSMDDGHKPKGVRCPRPAQPMPAVAKTERLN